MVVLNTHHNLAANHTAASSQEFLWKSRGIFLSQAIQFHGKKLAVTNDSEWMFESEVTLNLCSSVRGSHHQSVFHECVWKTSCEQFWSLSIRLWKNCCNYLVCSGKWFFLGVKSIYMGIYTHTHTHTHIYSRRWQTHFWKVLQANGKTKQNVFFKKQKIYHRKDNNRFHVWRQQTGIKYKGIILFWTRELLL